MDRRTEPTRPLPSPDRPISSRRLASAASSQRTLRAPAPPRAEPEVEQGWGWLLRGLIWGLVLAVLVFLAGALFLYKNDWILPGVRVMGIELQGRTTAEAASILQSEWQAKTVVLEDGAKSWTFPQEKLGFVLDAQETVRLAHAQGRSTESLDAMRRAGWQATVDPVWHFEPATAEATLRALSPEIDLSAKSAQLEVVGGQAQAVRPLKGRALDAGATAAWLSQHSSEVAAGERVPLTVVPVEPAVADVSGAVKQANALLAHRISMRLYDPIADQRFDWSVPREALADFLTFSLDASNPPRLQWKADPARVQKYLSDQSATLGGGRYVKPDQAVPAILGAIPKDATELKFRVYHADQTHKVRSGETLSSIADDYGVPYPWIEQANGITDTLTVGQVVTIPSLDNFVPLPVVENKRIVVSIGKQRVTVYENGNVKWDWPASTGIASSPTSPGIFQIQSHDPNAYASSWDLWMPWFMGIYRPVPTSNFMNGFHGFPFKGGRQIIWTSNLGRPITYGCILLSTDNEKMLYDWAEEGIVVEVKR